MLKLADGNNLDHVRAVLTSAAGEAANALSSTTAIETLSAYIRWATRQAAALRLVLAPEEVDRFVTTRRYWSLISTDSSLYGTSLGDIVRDELGARQEALQDAVTKFDRDVEAWRSTAVVIPDTTVFVEMGSAFPESEWFELAEVRGDIPLVLLVTMAVVEELDKKKLSRDNSEHGTAVRTKVRGALRQIEELFPSNDYRVRIHSDRANPGNIVAALLTDELGHTPLLQPDAEMIRRGLDLLPYAGQVKLVTYDLNQAFRARAAGLKAVRLRYEYER